MIDALIISTKRREDWTYENKQLIDRLAQRLHSAAVTLEMRCKAQACPDPQLRLVRDASDPGGLVLECGCTRRFFEPSRGQRAGRILR
jgi:hypothetical protein